jgi:hypothetical protein
MPHLSVSLPEPNMVDDVPLRTAVHAVWSLYLAKHRDVDDADSRRCLLEGRSGGSTPSEYVE